MLEQLLIVDLNTNPNIGYQVTNTPNHLEHFSAIKDKTYYESKHINNVWTFTAKNKNHFTLPPTVLLKFRQRGFLLTP